MPEYREWITSIYRQLPVFSSAAGLATVCLAYISQANYRLSVYLCLLALVEFVISLRFTFVSVGGLLNQIARWISLIAFAAVALSFGIYVFIGGTPDKSKRGPEAETPRIQGCNSELSLASSGWTDIYQEGSKYIPIAPTYYFEMRGNVTPSDKGLQATGYVYGKAWYVFWVRWGDIQIDLYTQAACQGQCVNNVNQCKADFSTIGNSSRQKSIVRGILEKAGARTDNEVRMTVVLSGSLSATGGPSIEAGKEPLSVSVAWPEATAENTFQAGTYKWQCKCANH